MSTNLVPESSVKYVCESCDYCTSRKSQYERHVATNKHKQLQKSTKINNSVLESSTSFLCNCGKKYKDRTGLWRHKKKCIDPEEGSQEKKQNYSVLNENVLALIKQNQELQKQLFELASKPNTINNNTNNTMNNSFNLNMFLNETCKDAMNLTDFVDSLKISFADLENTGKLGYEKGISQIFINGLKQLELNKRPIHCTDTKREKLHIRDKDAWETDQEKEKIRMAVRKVANKNVNQIADWFNANPDAHDYHSKKNDQYLNIVLESTGGSTKEEEEKRINKVISVIAKHVEIDKGSSA
jgi:hypothetical protein